MPTGIGWPPSAAQLASGGILPANAIVTDAATYTVDENQTVNISVSLAVAPSVNVNVWAYDVYAEGGTSVTSSIPLIFTNANFATPQTVTIQGTLGADGTSLYVVDTFGDPPADGAFIPMQVLLTTNAP
jgi:hypothetical protein